MWGWFTLQKKTSYICPYKAKKGEDGKPLTKPRNMLAGSNRSGIDRKSYVSPMTSLHAGDHYLDPEKVDLKYYQTFHTRSTIH
jgi:hypothetical protein